MDTNLYEWRNFTYKIFSFHFGNQSDVSFEMDFKFKADRKLTISSEQGKGAHLDLFRFKNGSFVLKSQKNLQSASQFPDETGHVKVFMKTENGKCLFLFPQFNSQLVLDNGNILVLFKDNEDIVFNRIKFENDTQQSFYPNSLHWPNKILNDSELLVSNETKWFCDFKQKYLDLGQFCSNGSKVTKTVFEKNIENHIYKFDYHRFDYRVFGKNGRMMIKGLNMTIETTGLVSHIIVNSKLDSILEWDPRDLDSLPIGIGISVKYIVYVYVIIVYAKKWNNLSKNQIMLLGPFKIYLSIMQHLKNSLTVHFMNRILKYPFAVYQFLYFHLANK